MSLGLLNGKAGGQLGRSRGHRGPSTSPVAAVRCVERDGCNKSTRLGVCPCFSGLEIQGDRLWLQQDGSQQTAWQRLMKV